MDRLHDTTSQNRLRWSWLTATVLIVIATMVALASTPPGELEAAAYHQQPETPAIEPGHMGSHLTPPSSARGSFLVQTGGYETTTGR